MAFVRTVKLAEVPPGTVRELHVEGKAIAMANVEGKVLTCPWHGWQYDLTSGRTVQNPAVAVDCYPTEVRGEDVFVDVDSGS